MNDLTSIFPILEEMNRRAGEIVRKYCGTQLKVETKDDQTPVTRADREVETFLRKDSALGRTSFVLFETAQRRAHQLKENAGIFVHSIEKLVNIAVAAEG